MTEAADRYDCLQYLASRVKDEIVVSGVGFQEWIALTKNRQENCMNGHLGMSVPLAMGIALSLPHRKVVCLSSDGDLLLQLSAVPAMGEIRPVNLVVVVNDNESYQTISKGSKGYWPTHTRDRTDLEKVAKACGVDNAMTVRTLDAFKVAMDGALAKNEFAFIVVKTEATPLRAVRPDIDGDEAKYKFARYIESSEGVAVLPKSPSYRSLVAPK